MIPHKVNPGRRGEKIKPPRLPNITSKTQIVTVHVRNGRPLHRVIETLCKALARGDTILIVRKVSAFLPFLFCLG